MKRRSQPHGYGMKSSRKKNEKEAKKRRKIEKANLRIQKKLVENISKKHVILEKAEATNTRYDASCAAVAAAAGVSVPPSGYTAKTTLQQVQYGNVGERNYDGNGKTERDDSFNVDTLISDEIICINAKLQYNKQKKALDRRRTDSFIMRDIAPALLKPYEQVLIEMKDVDYLNNIDTKNMHQSTNSERPIVETKQNIDQDNKTVAFSPKTGRGTSDNTAYTPHTKDQLDKKWTARISKSREQLHPDPGIIPFNRGFFGIKSKRVKTFRKFSKHVSSLSAQDEQQYNDGDYM